MNRNRTKTMPGEWVRLRDGRRACIRRWQPEDQPEVVALFERLSPQSLAQRFHSACIRLTAAVLDQVTAGYALVAELEGQIVALASYHPQPDRSQAEVAIVVDDANQGYGIGTALCASVALAAQRAGIQQLRADVLGSNLRMLRLLRGLHYPMTQTRAYGVVEVAIDMYPAAA